MRRINGSLRLVRVQNLEVYKNSKGKWKANFQNKGVGYEGIAMTDPNNYKPGTIGEAHIVLSLPIKHPFMKFVAAIYPLT
jgi:hypothetical protein